MTGPAGRQHGEPTWARVKELFHALLDRPEEEWRAYLDVACRDEPEVRREVERLLEADGAGGAGSGMRSRVAALAAQVLGNEEAAPPGDDGSGRIIGPYRLVRRIGSGGMGTVYLAERDDVRKRVALKVVRGGLAAPELVRRFLVERRVLARLEHPAIAPLLDAGVTDDGTPWLAMELVDGQPITRYCQERALPLRERLGLVLQVCDALAYAHAHLVVHRDIKPSNVLVDAGGRVKLLDFGIAKLLGEDDDGETTRTGAFVCSPEFAAPEQISGGVVTTATDVHALGGLLFEVLSGERPYRGGSPGAAAAARAILETQPRRLSAVGLLPAAAAGARAVPADLDAICFKALAREPGERYQSAREMADDLARYLDGFPVEARPPSVAYRTGKFLRRHRTAVAAAAILVTGLGGGLGAAVWQGARARAALAESEEVGRFLASLFEGSDPEAMLGPDVEARTLLEEGRRRIDVLGDHPLAQARMLDVMSRAYRGVGDASTSLALAERSVVLRTDLLGPDHADVASSLTSLAEALDDAGREADAADAFRRALSIRRARLGDTDSLTTGTMIRLARLLVYEGEQQEALELAEEALRLRRADRRRSPISEAWALQGLATVRWQGPGDLDGAEALLREAVALLEAAYGPDDVRVERPLVPLGGLLSQQHRHDEALAVAHRALALRERIYGPENPAVAFQLSNVAYVLSNGGRQAEARKAYREVEARYRKIFSGDHPRIANALTGIAGSFSREGMPDSALAYMQEAAVMILRLNGPDHPETALAYHNLGSSLMGVGRVAEAVEALSMAWDMRSRVHGASHPGALRTGSLYGWALLRQDRDEEAERVLRQVLEAQRSAHPGGHPDVAVTLGRLARLARERERIPEATALLEEALVFWRGLETPNRAEHRFVAGMLAGVYEELGRRDEAEALRREEERSR